MKKYVTFCLFLVFFFSIQLQSEQQEKKQPPHYRQEPNPVTIHKIRGNIYELRGGSGANSACMVTEKGIFVFDAKMDVESAQAMKKKIREVSDIPVTDIILTHSDGDHIQGLPGFPQGLTIISHRNTRQHIDQYNSENKANLPLPSMTFTESLTIHSGETAFELYYYGPAHTNGDIIIYFPQEKVAILGDLYFKNRDPLIHMHKNGSSFGLAHALEQILALDADIFLSGHSEPAAREDIQEYYQALKEKQKKVKDLVEAGKSLDDVKKVFGLPLEEQRWKNLVEVIYMELTEKK
ncbi:MAG: MBL fold metallo-hydrolase [Candidatus Aminicenantes bacterium]|nr:MBL fold metallo-hydrolase [Candidatus Aminicenantes bacterium]